MVHRTVAAHRGTVWVEVGHAGHDTNSLTLTLAARLQAKSR